ncbi:MAG TPA: T9SS type A sorting domain-containing protein [Bacteroidia bacterium]|nr:T9SS type A sorting domain-containing protein [Bacteroidia bacterium]
MKRILFILVFSGLHFSFLLADNYYWVGGTGNWSDYVHHWAVSSGAQLYHDHVPTPQDTVIFDSLSFTQAGDTVYADTSIMYCHTMKWENVQFHPRYYCNVIYTNSFLRIYGSLLLDTGMTWSYEGRLIFSGQQGNLHLRCAGQYLYSLEFSGDTASHWETDDSLSAGSLHLFSGGFSSNGMPMNVSQLVLDNFGITGFDLDTSTLYVVSFESVVPPSLVDADGSIIFAYGSPFRTAGISFGVVDFVHACYVTGGGNFRKAIFNSDATLASSFAFDTLVVNGTGTKLVLQSGSVQVINDTMIDNGGCRGLNEISASVYGVAAQLSKAAGSITMDRMFLENVDATGGAAFTASNSVLMNSSGWTSVSTPAPRNLWWTGNSGTWSDTAHWASSPGGPGGECAPTPLDSVFVDTSVPANDTIVTDYAHIYCGNFDWSTGGSFLQQSVELEDFGSMQLDSAMSFYSPAVNFRSPQMGNVISPAGKAFGIMSFTSPGSWDLTGRLSASEMNIAGGSFSSNANVITAGTISIGGNPSSVISFGGSYVLASRWENYSPVPVFTAPDTLITNELTDMSANYYPVVIFPNGGSLSANSHLHKTSFGGNTFISGNNLFDSLLIAGQGEEISFESGSTQLLGYFDVQSSCTGMSWIHGSVTGQAASLNSISGTMMLHDVILDDLSFSGSCQALNSIANSNVNGITVTPPPSGPMYWINGTGNWNDPMHWSPVSGGAPGTCVPNPLTDVFFDANSFTSPSDAVQLNVPVAYCHDMTWSNCAGAPAFTDSWGNGLLKCYGGFSLDTNVTADNVSIHFRAGTGNHVINTNGQPLGNLYFEGIGGSWSLQSDLSASAMRLNYGNFYTNSHTLQLGNFSSDMLSLRSLHLDTSLVYCGNWEAGNDSLFTLDADSSVFVITGDTFRGGNRQYYPDVTFAGDVNVSGSDTIGIARFTGMTALYSAVTFDTLLLDNPGSQLTIGPGLTETVRGKMLANSSASKLIGVFSGGAGFASLQKTADTVCLNFLVLQGIHAVGGATFYAGTYSTDIGNNSGWTFQDCNPQTVDVWPGDANRDLTADNLDLLAIGVAFGQSKTPRSNASNNWTAQPSWIWQVLFANGTDITNADCDGDGTVGYSDTTALVLNYGLTHPARYSAPDSTQVTGPKLWMLTPAYVNAGDTGSIAIMLGDSTMPANGVYGISFQLNYNDSDIIAPGSVWIEFDNSWMAPTGSVVHLLKSFTGQSIMEVAISRIDHHDVSGSGMIARIHFTANANYFGLFKGWFTDMHMINSEEVPLPVSMQLGTFYITGMQDYSSAGFHGYPNPTDGNYFIDDPSLAGTSSVITVTDLQGRTLYEEKSRNETFIRIDLSALPAGTYFISVTNENGTFIQRVIRQ